ncbi:MAG: hypothetical protein Q8O43_04005, partial [Dehalococcoidia bacterium]|nr:hypothetical protein [Dehalococcoidia bacterium]
QNRMRFERMLKELMQIQDEAKLDEALANLVKDGKITAEQAVKIKEQWKAQRERIQFQQLLKRLLSIQDEAKLDEALANLVKDGKITAEQAAKIKEQWKKLKARSAATN